MVYFRRMRFWGLAGIVLMMSSCIKDTIDLSKISTKIDWNPVYGIPMAYGNITLKDFINSLDSLSVIKEYPNDSLLYITYRKNILSQSASDLLIIPEQDYSQSFQGTDVDFPPLPLPVTDSIHFVRNTQYTFGFSKNEEIDSIHIKTGTINFNIQSGFLHTGWIKITLTTLKQNGTPIQQYIPITKADGSFSTTVSVNIDNSSLVLSTVGGIANQCPYTFEVVLHHDAGQPILVNQKIDVGIQIQNIKFAALYGYIGDYTILDITDNFKLNIFNSLKDINLVFANPKIKLFLSNSFGVPIQTQFYNTYCEDSKKTSFPLTFSPTVNPKIIASPTLNNYRITHDTLSIDNTSSNISTVIGKNPDYLYYGINATTNPAGKTFNYITDTSKLSADFEVELPLDLKATQYVQRDTIAFDMSKIPDISIVKQLLIHSKFNNTIPFDLNVQIIFTDDKYVGLDSLYTAAQQPLIASAPVDNTGKVTSPLSKTTDALFTGAQIIKIKNAKFAIIRAILTTAGNGTKSVKFFSYSKLNVSLGIITELQVTNTKQLK